MLFREILLFVVRTIQNTQIQSVGRMQILYVKARGKCSDYWAVKG
jgi:hypothetical protein